MDVLKRVEELKKKIAELQSGGYEGSPPPVAGPNKNFPLDFIESDNIHEVETGIRETLAGIALSKAALCKALANIVTKKLYTQVEARSFFEYLEMGRIPLNYKTAKEYAKIGDAMLRYNDELESVHFKEEDGLKKLVYLEKALDRCEADRELVFEKIKENSLREFQHWIKELGRGGEDAEGRQWPKVYLQGNSVFIERVPGRKQEFITTRPAELGIDPESREWAGFMEELQKLLNTYFPRDTHFNTGDNR